MKQLNTPYKNAKYIIGVYYNLEKKASILVFSRNSYFGKSFFDFLVYPKGFLWYTNSNSRRSE